MLKMRLQRVGRKHEPTFRLVLTDSKNSTKSGRFQEILGAYDPRRAIDSFNTQRIQDLLKQGVGLTGSVNNLLVKHGILRGKKVHVGSNFMARTAEPTTDDLQPAPVEESASAVTPELESIEEPIVEAVPEAAPVEEEKKEEPAPQE